MRRLHKRFFDLFLEGAKKATTGKTVCNDAAGNMLREA